MVTLWRRRIVTAIFSAKETLYKCLNPLVGRFFDFLDARVLAIDPTKNAFQVQLLSTLSPGFLGGTILSETMAVHTGKKPTRTHDGQVITLRSNTRWCSDSFEIRCWNGEVVRVVFSLDTCDRECMRYRAVVKAGISGELVRDLMVDTVEHRFGAGTKQVPHAVEWLSDNGSCYTAHETVSFGSSLGLLMCTTPAYSPESNGMAESFVKTVRRDYVYLSRLDTAAVVLQQVPRWFEDYNEVHPHKGLKMRSPREYRRAVADGAP